MLESLDLECITRLSQAKHHHSRKYWSALTLTLYVGLEGEVRLHSSRTSKYLAQELMTPDLNLKLLEFPLAVAVELIALQLEVRALQALECTTQPLLLRETSQAAPSV